METGDVARALGVATETVRKWERQGIIAPPLRTTGGRRLFSIEQVEKMRAQRQTRMRQNPPRNAA